MDRILISLFVICFSQISFANFLSPDELSRLNNKIDVIQEIIEDNQSNIISDQFISEVKSSHQMLVQFFADPEVPIDQKHQYVEIYNDMSSVLQQLGNSVSNISIDSLETMAGVNNGIIRGVVKNRTTTQPIQYAKMSLYSSDGIFLSADSSDDQGRYAFLNVADGEYLVSASHSQNYISQFYLDTDCPGGLGYGCQVNDLTPLTISNGEMLEDINFNLEKTGQITGILTDEVSNSPIHGLVSLYDSNYQLVRSQYSSYSDGSFTIYVNNDEPHYLQFSTQSHYKEVYDDLICIVDNCDFSQATPISVTQASTHDLGTVSLEKYHVIKGRSLEFSTNVPITEYNSVRIYESGTSYVVDYVNTIENDGYWHSSPLPPGNYEARNTAAGYLAQNYRYINCPGSSFSSCNQTNADLINHDWGQDTSGIDFKLRKGGVIKGKIFNSDSQRTDAYVYLYNSDGDAIENSYTFDNGLYEFKGLSNGQYYVSASNYQHQVTLHPNVVCIDLYYDVCNTPEIGNPILLTGLGEFIKNVKLRKGGSISGQVRDANNIPIEFANVTLEGDNQRYQVSTDSSGFYEFTNITPGSYYIVGASYKHAMTVYPNYTCPSGSGCNYENGAALNVTSSSHYTNRNLTLSELGNIQFNLKDINNAPVKSGKVYVYNHTGSYMTNSTLSQEGKVDFYLYPGSYYFSYIDNYYDIYISKIFGGSNCTDNCVPTSGSLIPISLSQEKVFNMQISQAFRLKGTFNTDESNYGGAKIKIYQNNELVISKSLSHNSYDVPIKLNGTIKVEAYMPGYYSKYYNGVECYGTNCGLSNATNINIVYDQSRTINFDLNILNHLNGKVKNINGNGLAGINVEINNNDTYYRRTVTTDSNGNYEINGIQPGFYTIKALTDGVYETTIHNDSFEISPGDNFASEDIIMIKRGSIHITDMEYINGDIAANVNVGLLNVETEHTYWFNSDNNGSITPINLPDGEYKLSAKVGSYSNSLYTAYPNLDCSLVGYNECLSQSPSFNITTQNEIEVTDFKINEKGKIFAYLFDSVTNQTIDNINVIIYNSSLQSVQNRQSDNGVAELKNLNPGEYYIYAKTDAYDNYISELYEEINCHRGIGIDCILLDGTPVNVSNNTLNNITINLDKKPKLTVSLLNNYTQEQITGQINVYDESGEFVISSNYYSSVFEFYLDAGQYYVTGSSDYFNTIAYPNAICDSNNSLSSCSQVDIEQVTLTENNASINLGLDLINGINGQVLDAQTNAPIEGAVIDFWQREDMIQSSVITNSSGKFSKYLYSYYDYWVSTDISISSDYYNEIYNNIRCFDGPAIIELCDISLGEKIVIDASNNTPVIIEFRLDKDSVFKSNFD